MVFVASFTLAVVSAFFASVCGHASAEHEPGTSVAFGLASLIVAALAVAVARFA